MSARNRLLELRKLPIQERSRSTVEVVLTAATQIFEEHGYAAGTTNRIAEKAGVSIGSLYQYFPSKEAIAVALLERHLSETKSRLIRWVDHMIEEQHTLHNAVVDYVESMIDIHSVNPRLQHILLEEIPLPPRVHELILSAEQDSAVTMGKLLQRYPEIKHRSLERAGVFIVQTVESLTHRFAAHPESQLMDRNLFAKELIAMLEAYLSYDQN